MSPSSRGILAGLLLAAPVLLATLSLNEGWLLPAADETGVAYLLAAPAMAAGDDVVLPWAEWNSEEPSTPFAGRGPLMPWIMAKVLPIRPQPHVAALWTLAGSAGLLVLFVGWAAGGAAGVGGALVAGLMLIASGASAGLVTTIRPEILAMACIALLLGLMTYKPSWSLAHGGAAAAAWLAHPAGVGAVVATCLWAGLRSGSGASRVVRTVEALAVPLSLVLLGPLTFPGPNLAPSGLVSSLFGAGASLLTWAGGGWGVASLLAGFVVLPGIVLLVLLDAIETPDPPPDVHWKDPAAADALANSLRPSALLLAVCLGAAALAGIGAGYGSMAASWTLMMVPVCAVTGTSLVRIARRKRSDRTLVVAGTVLWLALTGIDAARSLRSDTTEGRALTHRSWVSSELIRWVDNRSRPWPVMYTDQPALLQIQSGRASSRLPTRVDDLADFEEVFRRRPGAIVLTQENVLPADVLEERLGVTMVMDTELGRVLVPN